MAGVAQMLVAYFRGGVIGNFFPTSVIKAMVTGIGLVLVLKQLPHMVGYDLDFMGDEGFFQLDGANTFSELIGAFNSIQLSTVLISLLSLIMLVVFGLFPGSILAVASGAFLNQYYQLNAKVLEVTSLQNFHFSWSFNFELALTIAIIGTLETLASLEATEKLDPLRRSTPRDKFLMVHGAANVISGVLGGLPIISVLIRSSTNISSGAKTKYSSVFHGIWLLLILIFLNQYISFIPLATLSVIIFFTAIRLIKLDELS